MKLASWIGGDQSLCMENGSTSSAVMWQRQQRHHIMGRSDSLMRYIVAFEFLTIYWDFLACLDPSPPLVNQMVTNVPNGTLLLASTFPIQRQRISFHGKWRPLFSLAKNTSWFLLHKLLMHWTVDENLVTFWFPMYDKLHVIVWFIV